jgi:superfamily II DNA or RNA helicase
MKIEDFIESYVPNKQIFGTNLIDFNQELYDLKEFRDLKLTSDVPMPKRGELLPNQKIVQRFMGSYTPYDGLLLFHEVGVGKTCSSVGVAEQIREFAPQFKRCLVLLKGKTLMDNYINELVFVCTNGKYIPENYETLTALEKTIRVKKMVNDYYEFSTFEVFSKKIQKLTEPQIRAFYDNSVVIIDEVHNLKGDLDEYVSIHRFLHAIRESKKIVMSATPMTDKVEEIADIMNLILPIDQQLPTKDAFKEEYLDEKGDSYSFKEDKIDLFATYITGRISYLKAPKGDVRRVYEGEHIGQLKYFNVYAKEMEDKQSNAYANAYRKDKEEKAKTGIYSNSRQASLLVYPDNSYGQTGFTKFIRIDKKLIPGEVNKYTYSYNLTSEFKSFISPSADISIEEKLANLKLLSVKYYTVVKHLLENREKLQFIYGDLVEGSGLIVFSKILELFGYSNTKGKENKKGLRFAIFTNKTITSKQIKNVLETFNSPDNMNGKYIHVIMGSSLIAEGLSFKNVQDVHILTPHWNYSETEQAVGRALRLFSHQALLNAGIEVVVKIYHHVALSKVKSVDLMMYEYSEKKDISIKSMERVIETIAFDCQLTKARNEVQDNYYDGSRLCEYQSCKYDCYGISDIDTDVNTANYNQYYLKEDYAKFEQDIKQYFASRNFANFKYIKEEFSNIPESTLLYALDIFIKNRIPILTNNGLICYLCEEMNNYYLSDNIHTYTQNFGDNVYVNKPILIKKESFQTIIDDLELSILSTKIDNLLSLVDNKVSFENLLKTFPEPIKEYLLENAVLAETKKLTKNIYFRSNILEFFANNLVKKGNITYSTLVKPMRCFDGKEWDDCTKAQEKAFTEEKQDIEKEFIENPYGFYGILDTVKGKFLIRDVSRKELIEIKDKRKQSTGKDCKSWERQDLVNVSYKLKLPMPANTFTKETRKQLIDLTEKTKYKNAALAFSKEEMESMELEELKRIVYYAAVKKEEFCDIIQKWFKDKNLLLVK